MILLAVVLPSPAAGVLWVSMRPVGLPPVPERTAVIARRAFLKGSLPMRVDWASDHHDVALIDQAGELLECGT